ARTPTPSPSWRVQPGTLGGRFFAFSAPAPLAPAAASPAAPARNRRRVAPSLSFGFVMRPLYRQRRLITFYFLNVIEFDVNSRKFSRSRSAQPAPSFPPQHSARPDPRPADLPCPR